MKPPSVEIMNSPDMFLAWLSDLWKFVALCSGKVATGTYTGDGSTGLAITGVGFQPKYVRIWIHPNAEADTAVFEKLDQTWGDYAVLHSVTATHEHYIVDNRINSLDSDGFTVDDDGANGHPNANGVTYNYLCLG